MPNARRFAYPFLLTAVVLGVVAVPGSADLNSRYQDGQQRAKALGSQIAAQSRTIEGYQGTINNLEGRLAQIENALGVQERLLSNVTFQLNAARSRLTSLRGTEARDQQTLAASCAPITSRRRPTSSPWWSTRRASTSSSTACAT